MPEEHPLHRPRHGGRQWIALSCALIFFLAPFLAVAAGVEPEEFENRALAPAPSLASGWRFFTGFSTWATDRLPFRDSAVAASDGLSRNVFREPASFDGTRPVTAPEIAPDPPSPIVAQPSHGPGFPKVIEGSNGWLYFGYDVEAKCAPLRPLDESLAAVTRLRAAVERSGRRFVLVVPPDKSTAVPQHLPARYAGQDCARAATAEFWRRAVTEAGALDLRHDLRKAATTGPPIYHRLDTHWTDLGSLTMVRALAEQIQPGVTSRWAARPERPGAYDADLPRLIGRTGRAEMQQYSLAPDGRRDRTRPVETDLRAAVRYQSPPGPGMVTEPVAMLTDSFSLSASRYLDATFSDLQVIYYSSAVTDIDAVID
ncbi:MAG: alginate O-acetyltransferase AlgX-related protein, partial [Pseudonocardiaceae bacterium]